jgi:hypothetical protein
MEEWGISQRAVRPVQTIGVRAWALKNVAILDGQRFADLAGQIGQAQPTSGAAVQTPGPSATW